MKILQVNNFGYLRGGSDRYFLDVSNLLLSKGHEVRFFVPRDSRNVIEPAIDFRGLDMVNPGIGDLLSFAYSLNAKNALLKLLDEFKPDIVHLHIIYGQISSSILALLKDRGIPVVQTLHEYKALCSISSMYRDGRHCDKCSGGNFSHAARNNCRNGYLRSSLLAMESYVAKHFFTDFGPVKYFAVSEFVRRKYLRYGFQAKQISTVENFVRDECFVTHNVDEGYYLYMGRIEEIKGLRTLIHAFAKLPNVKLHIAGEGSFLPEMQMLKSSLEAKNILFVGFLQPNELNIEIARCRAVVVPSEWDETFGLVIVEALAASKPVIASRRGGMEEILESTEGGILFDSGSVEALIKAVTLFENSDNFRRRCGQVGNQNAKKLYSSSSHYEKLITEYRLVL